MFNDFFSVFKINTNIKLPRSESRDNFSCSCLAKFFFLREIKRCIFCFIQNGIKILSLTSIFHKQLIIKIT